MFKILDLRNPIWGVSKQKEWDDIQREKEAEKSRFRKIPDIPPNMNLNRSTVSLQEYQATQAKMRKELSLGPNKKYGTCDYVKRNGLNIRVTGQTVLDKLEHERSIHRSNQMDAENEQVGPER